MLLFLTRDQVGEVCCLGVLHAGALSLQTVELPWVPSPEGRGGLEGASCIAPGTYRLERHDSPTHPRTFALVNPELDVFHLPTDVPTARLHVARTTILIHVANFPHQLLGCIGVGMARGFEAVLRSREAFDRFKLVVPWIDGHTLQISTVEGVPR